MDNRTIAHGSFFTVIVAVAFSSLVLGQGAAAAVYHVDARYPGAADGNRGDAETPFATISRAAEVVVPGDEVLIHTGIYCEEVRIKANGTAEAPIVFAAAQGARVVVTGADALTNLTREAGDDNIYSSDWPYRYITRNKHGTHPDDAYHAAIGRVEQVIIDGYLLQQVLERKDLARGTFYVDLEAKRIYLWDAADRKLNDVWGPPLVEASSRQGVWLVDGAYVHTRGIRFRYAANMAQHGAVKLEGEHDVLEDCIVERVNSCGAGFLNKGIVVRACTFRDNGQLGFTAVRAHGLLVVDCLVENNNTKGWNRGWEAGGAKLTRARDVVLERSRFIRNRGNGVWFDIGNENCTVRNCLIAENESAGIFYEISYGLRAHDNVIVGNGYITCRPSWGANGGISLSSSPDCIVERNLIVANYEGFQFREAPRTTALIGQKKGDHEVAVWNHDNIIRNNLIAWNTEFQVGGWFADDSMNHWPKAMQSEIKPAATGTQAEGDFAAEYLAKGPTGKPTGLTLETLNLRFENNLFSTIDRQPFCLWGVKWKVHRIWPSLEETADQLTNFKGNTEAPVTFADFLKMDLRLRGNSPAVKSGCYPRGEVPGVTLGILP